jgi:protein-tyrosine-phosphatase
MAEGLLNAHFGDRFLALSAGTRPTRLHPLAVQAMAEIGIDISSHRSKHIAELRDEEFDYVVTVCDRARETCPFSQRPEPYSTPLSPIRAHIQPKPNWMPSAPSGT